MRTPQAGETVSTDVLIVGAGPSGLALGATLAARGVDFAVVDRLATGENTSRAAVIHAHTLEILEEIGVAGRLAQEGLRLARFSIRDRDRTLVRLRFDTLPTRYPYLLMLPQDRTEQILEERVVAAGGAVRRGWEVRELAEEDDRIAATAVSDAGRCTYRARYVIGADGMASRVREAAGIGFTGSAYEESFVLADVAMEWGHGNDEGRLFFSPAGLVVVAPLPGGTFRVVATLDDAPERPGVADVQALLDARGPTRGPARIAEVVWGSRFRIHHRVADAYRRGRYLLVGDAAHVHSPAGGQGMNTGLVDACVLGRILGEVLVGGRDPSLLDAYERLRRPAAEEVLRIAGRLTRLATMRGAPRRAVRNVALSLVNRLPPIKRRLALDLSGLARAAAADVPGAP